MDLTRDQANQLGQQHNLPPEVIEKVVQDGGLQALQAIPLDIQNMPMDQQASAWQQMVEQTDLIQAGIRCAKGIHFGGGLVPITWRSLDFYEQDETKPSGMFIHPSGFVLSGRAWKKVKDGKFDFGRNLCADCQLCILDMGLRIKKVRPDLVVFLQVGQKY